jgi:hypothetical protein
VTEKRRSVGEKEPFLPNENPMATSLLSILLFIGIIWCLFAFIPDTPAKTQIRAFKASSPIEGAWELYSTESGGITTFHKKPTQIKVYSNGHACMMAYDENGKFSYAAAGSYELEGNQCKETCTHHSYESAIGLTMWWKWSKSTNGDTLYFSGPSKVIRFDGQDITHEWKEQIFEKKVRVKK